MLLARKRMTPPDAIILYVPSVSLPPLPSQPSFPSLPVSRPFPLPELSRFVAIQLLTLPRNCYRVFPNLIPTAQTILLEDEDDREKRGGGERDRASRTR